MFLSYLQSMQTNSQNAQNPGLWVNGNRMPMLDPNRSLPNQLFPAVNARENEAAAKASFVNKANRIGAEGISPEFGQEHPQDPYAIKQAGINQMTQNTQAYGSGKNMRWVDPAGVMHRGSEGVDGRAVQSHLDRSPIKRSEISLSGAGKELSPIQVGDDKMAPQPPQGYHPHGSGGDYRGGVYSIIDNPNASYGTDDPITRAIRATRSNNAYQDATSSPSALDPEDSSVQWHKMDRAGIDTTKRDGPNWRSDNWRINARGVGSQHDQMTRDNSNPEKKNKNLQEMSQQYFPSSLQETSNKRRAAYIRRVSGQASNEANAAMERRSDRQKKKTESGRGVRLAFKGEDGQGIPAELLGGRMVKDAIAQDLGVPDEFVYPDKKITADPLLALNMFNAMNSKDLNQGRIYMPLRSPPVF